MNLILRQSTFCSFVTEAIKPISIQLPLTQLFMSQFSLQQIDKNRSDQTLIYLFKKQKAFPFTAVIHTVFLLLVGLFLLYLGIIGITLSLFNPILLFIVIGIEVSYAKWVIKTIKNHRYKVFEKKVRKWLQKQNKEFYSRKLIRWVYDPDHRTIMVHNLRLCQ